MISHLRKNKSILVGGGSQEGQSVCYIYDIIIFPVGFSFVVSPFQYHNALRKAQMQYRLLFKEIQLKVLVVSIKKKTYRLNVVERLKIKLL